MERSSSLHIQRLRPKRSETDGVGCGSFGLSQRRFALAEAVARRSEVAIAGHAVNRGEPAVPASAPAGDDAAVSPITTKGAV